MATSIIFTCLALVTLSTADEEKLPDSIPDCTSPIDQGTCQFSDGGFYIKWAYIPEKKKCQSFFRGECGGNQNAYISEEECLQYCRSKNNLRVGTDNLTGTEFPLGSMLSPRLTQKVKFNRKHDKARKPIIPITALYSESSLNRPMLPQYKNKSELVKKSNPSFQSPQIVHKFHLKETKGPSVKRVPANLMWLLPEYLASGTDKDYEGEDKRRYLNQRPNSYYIAPQLLSALLWLLSQSHDDIPVTTDDLQPINLDFDKTSINAPDINRNLSEESLETQYHNLRFEPHQNLILIKSRPKLKASEKKDNSKMSYVHLLLLLQMSKQKDETLEGPTPMSLEHIDDTDQTHQVRSSKEIISSANTDSPFMQWLLLPQSTKQKVVSEEPTPMSLENLIYLETELEENNSFSQAPKITAANWKLRPAFKKRGMTHQTENQPLKTNKQTFDKHWAWIQNQKPLKGRHH